MLHPLDRRTDKDCLTSPISALNVGASSKAETEPKNFHPIALVTLGRTIENFATYA